MAKASELKELSLADLQKARSRIQGRIIQPTFSIGYWSTRKHGAYRTSS